MDETCLMASNQETDNSRRTSVTSTILYFHNDNFHNFSIMIIDPCFYSNKIIEIKKEKIVDKERD